MSAYNKHREMKDSHQLLGLLTIALSVGNVTCFAPRPKIKSISGHSNIRRGRTVSMPNILDRKCRVAQSTTRLYEEFGSSKEFMGTSENQIVYEDVDGIGAGTDTLSATGAPEEAYEAIVSEKVDNGLLQKAIIDDLSVDDQTKVATVTTDDILASESVIGVNEIIGIDSFVPNIKQPIEESVVIDEFPKFESDTRASYSAVSSVGSDDTTTKSEMLVEISDITNNPILSEIITPDGKENILISENAIESMEAENSSLVAPSVTQIIKFAVPAIGVWLCSPFLSMIDTSAVGLISGTAQQAALNPAVAVTEYGALLMAFMYTATTNLVAEAQETDKNKEIKSRTLGVMKSALKLSGFVGGALSLVLLLFTRPLLKAIIGTGAVDPTVFAAALKYVRIRALGMPAAVVIGSAQAGCLGMKDIRSPLYVLATAAVVNLIGDIFLVGVKHPWVGGAAGAAWATVFSQYAALYMFMEWMKRPLKAKNEVGVKEYVSGGRDQEMMTLEEQGIPKDTVNKVTLTEAILEMTTPTVSSVYERDNVKKALKNLQMSIISKKKRLDRKLNSGKGKNNIAMNDAQPKNTPSTSPSVRGFLSGHLSKRDLFRLPALSDAKDFGRYFIPVTTTQVGRVSSYLAMAHVVSTSIGTAAMAAQQIIISIFYCLTPVADSLGLTAQSFVPGLAGAKKGHERSKALKRASMNFVKSGALFGVALMAVVGLIPLMTRFFTSDLSVLASINQIVPYLLGFFAMHGVICSVEGVLIGQKDLSFLSQAYASFFFGVPYFMLKIKKRAMAGVTVGLPSVWGVFLMYQVVRFGGWLVRLAMLTRKTNRESADVPSLFSQAEVRIIDESVIHPLSEVDDQSVSEQERFKNDTDELVTVEA